MNSALQILASPDLATKCHKNEIRTILLRLLHENRHKSSLSESNPDYRIILNFILKLYAHKKGVLRLSVDIIYNQDVEISDLM